MPAKNPRLYVTVTPEAAAVLSRLAALRSESVSGVVGGLIESTLPVFERMAAALEAAAALSDAADEATADIVRGLTRAQQRAETQLGLALDDLDEGTRPLLGLAESVSRRAAGSKGRGLVEPRSSEPAAVASTPVPVTRGSGPPRKAKSKGKPGGRHG